uniref:Fibrinogen C-terminal domain-containing protein n=1 Tax=Poecilia latipinna TaxID=48699 RepID=A0A3B3VKF6_9TELE
MLVTLGLILLLIPFPSFQTATLDKRDAAGSNVTKGNTVSTFSKPKTTAAPSKQSLNPTLKPNTVTVTILPTAGSNQRSAANAATTTKSKLSVAVVQTTPPSPARAPKATYTNRDKHKLNQTASTKLLSLSEEKANKIKSEPTGVHQDQSTITKLSSDKLNIHNTLRHVFLCLPGKLRFPFPTECSQELLNGALESGEVTIYPQGKEGRAVRVYCDMETDGGGWTVFQRRMNGKTDFYRTWSEYKAGFGNLSEENMLSSSLQLNVLRVDLESGNDTAYARYANFSVASEGRNYTLTVSGYTGTAGDSMKYHNGRPFSTRDKEPDPLGIHCAKAYVGGWWYKNCYKVNLNGLYGMNSNNQGIVWIDWKGKDVSIPFSEMKFRPSRFSPATHG